MKKRSIFRDFDVKTFMSYVYSGQRVCVSKKETFLVCHTEKVIKFIDLSSGQVLHSTECSDDIFSISLSPNSRKLSIALSNGDVCVRSVVANKDLRRLHFTFPVVAMDIDNSSNFLGLGFGNGIVRVYDIKQGICTHFHKKCEGRVGLLQFHPSKLFLFSSSLNGLVVLDMVANKTRRLNHHKGGVVLGLSFTKNEKYFVTTAVDKKFCVYDFEKMKIVKTITVYEDVVDLKVIPKRFAAGFFSNAKKEVFGKISDDVIVAGSRKGNLLMWDMNSGKVIAKNKGDKKPESLQYSYFLEKRREVLFTTEDCNFIMYDALTLEKKRHILGFQEEVLDITLFGETKFACATNSESILVFDTKTKESKVLSGHTNFILCLTSNNKFVVSGSKDNTIRVWDDRYRCVAIGDSHNLDVTGVRFSPNSKYFVSVSDDRTMKIYPMINLLKHLKKFPEGVLKDEDILPLQCTSVFCHSKSITDVDVAPNGSLIGTSSVDRTVKLWSLEISKNGLSFNTSLYKILKHPKGINCLRFSPVEKVIATGSSDNLIRLWSIESGTCLKVLEGCASSVLKVEFLNYGLQMVSASSAGLIKIWLLKTNECLNSFDNHKSKIWGLGVRNQGKELITGSEDSLINIWTENTKEIGVEKRKKREEEIVKKQEFENLMHQKNYKDALSLAISLDQPRNAFRLFQILKEKEIMEVVSKLEFKEVNFLFQYCIDWNTNFRFASIGNRVLNSMLRVFNPNFISWEYEKSLNSYQLYANKHIKRIDKILEDSYVLDFAMSQMNVLDEEIEVEKKDIKELTEEEKFERMTLVDPELDDENEAEDFDLFNLNLDIESVKQPMEKKQRKKLKQKKQKKTVNKPRREMVEKKDYVEPVVEEEKRKKRSREEKEKPRKKQKTE